MKKTVLLFLLFLVTIPVFSQSKIGRITLKDSSGTLVITAPIRTSTNAQWIERYWLQPLVNSSNSGLKWDSLTGLSLKLGTGLAVVNDTLKYNGAQVVDVDDTTLYYVGSKLRVRINNGIMKDLYGLSLKINSTNLDYDTSGNLQIKANSITSNQIDPDISLDSIKINGAKLTAINNKFMLTDSIYIGNGLVRYENGKIEFQDTVMIGDIAINDNGSGILDFIGGYVNADTITALNTFATSYNFMKPSNLNYSNTRIEVSGSLNQSIQFYPTNILTLNINNSLSSFYKPLHLENSISYKTDSIGSATNYTMTDSSYFLIVSCGSVNDTVTLVSSRNGVEYTVKMIATTGGNVVVKSASKIDGIDEDIIATPYVSRTYIYRNNKWWIK